MDHFNNLHMATTNPCINTPQIACNFFSPSYNLRDPFNSTFPTSQLSNWLLYNLPYREPPWTGFLDEAPSCLSKTSDNAAHIIDTANLLTGYVSQNCLDTETFVENHPHQVPYQQLSLLSLSNQSTSDVLNVPSSPHSPLLHPLGNKERIKRELELALCEPSPSYNQSVTEQPADVAYEKSDLMRKHMTVVGGVGKKRRSRDKKSKRARAPARPWTEEEHKRFEESLELFGRNWEQCAKYIGTRRSQLVRSHAQKHLIKLWKLGKPLPKKVAESGNGYTLSGKPLLAESASAKSYLTRIAGPGVVVDQSN